MRDKILKQVFFFFAMELSVYSNIYRFSWFCRTLDVLLSASFFIAALL